MRKLVYMFVASLAMISCQNKLIEDIDSIDDSALDTFEATSRSIVENDSTIYPW